MKNIAWLLLLASTGWADEFKNWTFSANGLVKQTPAGLHFDSAGVGYAVTPWNTGTQPFALTWEVEIEKGVAQAWRYPGVYVALTTAPPDKMGADDMAVLISLHLDGIIADVRQGRTFEPNTNETGWPPKFSNMGDRSLAKRFDLNQSGAGGRWYSVQWPNNDLIGAKLAFRITRTASNSLQFAFYHSDLPGEVWWSREWPMPASVAKADFQYIVVKTVINPTDYKNPGSKPEGGAMVGTIRNLSSTRDVAKLFERRPPMNDTGAHPYLYYHAKDLPELRKKFNEPQFAGYRSLILQNADDIPAGGKKTEKSGKSGIADLTWAYVLSGDKRYLDRLLPALEEESRSLSHEEFRMMAGHDMAVAYDALYAELPAELRDRMQRYLERVATVYVRNVKKNSWWYANNPSNVIPVGGCGGGAAGLALMHCSPIAKEAAKLAGPTVKREYKAIAPDGGCVEGTLYWNYGLTAQLRLGHMLQCATGDDAGLLDTPTLRKNYRFVETQLGGDGCFFTFNDTQPWLTGLAICSDLGSRFDQPLLLWLADYMANSLPGQTNRANEVSRGDVVPYAFLWRSRQPAPKDFPGVPTVSYLETMNWGVLRSDNTFKPKLVVGIKGSAGPLTHHAQPDLGSFVVQANGAAYLIDPGYYQEKPDAHSLPLINREGPSARGRALITDTWKSGMTVDATAAYKNAKRVRRHFVLVGDKAVVILDDIVADGKVTTQFQCGFPTVASNTTAIINGTFPLRVFGSAIELKATGPRDFGKSWIYKKLGVEWYSVNGDYEPTEPLVTVIGSADATVNRDNQTITVTVAGQTVRFRQGEKGWTR